jgi:hypothetical protein
MNEAQMMTFYLFDSTGKPIGRASLELTTDTPPAIVLWDDRAFLYFERRAGRYCYKQQPVIEIPRMELRKAPGLA